jgi:hypothetical protein
MSQFRMTGAALALLAPLGVASAAQAQYIPGGSCPAHQWIDAYGLATGLVCAQPGSADLSDTTAPTAYSPTDQSGASLGFTGISVKYAKLGSLVFVYGTLTYPSTASAANATISLPVAVPNQNYAQVPGMLRYSGTSVGTVGPVAVANTSTAVFVVEAGNAVVTNSQLSGKTIWFLLTYPAS